MRLPWDTQKTKDRQDGVYTRERSDDLYHTARWTRLSRAWRAQHPLCAECLRAGRYTEGEVTDHIVPWPVCEDFWNESNFQTLCQKCNHDKGQRDKVQIREWKRKRRG